MNGMPVTEMIVGISGGLFMLAAFLAVLRFIQSWLLHRTLRDAIGRDSPLAPALVDKLAGPRAEEPTGDDRLGLMMVAQGIALAAFAWVVGDPSWQRYGMGASLFPLLLGGALWARHIWIARQARRTGADIDG